MENFPKYFRRLLSGNAPQIFPGISRNVENPANYQILVREVENITKDPSQASRIADAIDTGGEGDIFRDFDLALFMEHFKMDAFSKTLLASAFAYVSRQDLRNKGTISELNHLCSDADLKSCYHPRLEFCRSSEGAGQL